MSTKGTCSTVFAPFCQSTYQARPENKKIQMHEGRNEHETVEVTVEIAPDVLAGSR